MKQLSNNLIGVDRGDVVLFSDFQDGGDMWTGSGPRERRRAVRFAKPYRSEPAVHVTVSLWDVDTGTAVRAEVAAEKVTAEGFEIVFRTWADTRVARIRVAWMAIGELPNPDDWEIY